jgi:U3 small nucleolar RNA-associated protein 10
MFSAKLQYLAQSDLKKYLDAVMDHREHIALDASYVKVFHVQHLGRDNGDKKKDSEYALFFKKIPS